MRRRRSTVNDPNILLANALVNVNGDNAVGVASVTSMPNIGTGGSAYNLDTVVGTGANLKKSISDACLLYGASGDYVSTPDSAAADITGDIDIRGKAALDDWTPSDDQTLVSKYDSTNVSYVLQVEITTGKLEFFHSPDGSSGSQVSVLSTVATGFVDGSTHWARVTVDVDNGASGNDIKFYTSDDGETWSQLGTTITTAGVISLFSGTAPVEVGSLLGGAFENIHGSIYQAQIYNGIDGTLAVDFNAADYVNRTSDTSFPSSATGEVYTLNGNSFIQNTGHNVVHSIGSAGLESTAGQTIASPGTVFLVARQSGTPAADQYFYDSRSDGSARWAVFADDSAGDKWIIFQGDTVIPLSEAFDNDAHVFTSQFNGDSTTKLTVSSVGSVTGDAGADNWDYGTLFAQNTGILTMQGYIAALYVFDYPLSETQVNAIQNFLHDRYRL